jgi:hypothetical protein
MRGSTSGTGTVNRRTSGGGAYGLRKGSLGTHPAPLHGPSATSPIRFRSTHGSPAISHPPRAQRISPPKGGCPGRTTELFTASPRLGLCFGGRWQSKAGVRPRRVQIVHPRNNSAVLRGGLAGTGLRSRGGIAAYRPGCMGGLCNLALATTHSGQELTISTTHRLLQACPKHHNIRGYFVGWHKQHARSACAPAFS